LVKEGGKQASELICEVSISFWIIICYDSSGKEEEWQSQIYFNVSCNLVID